MTASDSLPPTQEPSSTCAASHHIASQQLTFSSYCIARPCAGAYYYVWEAFSIPARPWPAEVGMQLVIANLTASGVPVSYLQLDDWW